MNDIIKWVVTMPLCFAVLAGIGGLLLACWAINSTFTSASNDKHPETSHRIIVIDGCEYILVSRRPYAPDFSLTHKGNCVSEFHSR